MTQTENLPNLQELLSDDAPLVALLSLRDNPLMATASEAELNALVMKLRIHAATPAKLRASVKSSEGVKKRSGVSAQKLAQMKKFADED